jgi:ribosomal protein S18 acetylase RimI-like enzyme
MIAASAANQVVYYKRYRMQLDLVSPLPAVPRLPADYSWVAWNPDLIDAHAEVKLQCFRDELDGVVFPNLSHLAGCRRLMSEISTRPGFRPESTWLIAHGANYVATVQGISDRTGAGAIQNLGVIPAYRGLGLGMAVLLKALHGFRQTGLGRATLEVTAQNEVAIQMYRKVGFRFRKTIYKVSEPSSYSLEPVKSDWSV